MGLTGQVVSIANMACGLLFIIVALPLQLGLVRRNHFYGVRLRQALQSDDAWRKINRFGGHMLSGWGVLLIAMGAALLLWPQLAPAAVIEPLAFAPATVVIPALVTWGYARSF